MNGSVLRKNKKNGKPLFSIAFSGSEAELRALLDDEQLER